MPRYTPKELYDNYRKGFSGCIFEQHVFDHLMETSKYPLFGDASKKISGSGKGKLSTPYKSVLKFDKNPYNERQTTGDCQNGSDLVRMADGSTKMIKDIKIDEYIISANGNKKRVLRTIKKQYNGKMVQIKVDGYCQTIASTPDHKYIVDPINMEYKAIAALEVGDSVYLPSINYEESSVVFDMANYFDGEVITHETDTESLRLEPVDINKIRAKNGRSIINRYIKLDEKLSWLVGLYAAEGGIDGVSNKQERITYNLGSHEAIMAEQVRQYFKDIFDIDAHLYQVPSKPTVIYVRINSVFIANLFKSLCSGNTYSKKLNNKFFITSKSNKLSLLKGWFDGDGHKGKSNSTAVSVSKQLITDFADIANSVDLSIAVRYRKAYAHSRESYTLTIKSQHSNQFNITKGQYITSISNSNTVYSGRMVKIKHIQIVEPEDKFVYCIEVEDDHNFICNGYGISNCVSHGTRNACDVSRAVEIDVGQEREDWVARGATEAIYGYRGFSGQGMSCARAAEFVSKVGGIVVRKNYGFVDFTKYNGNLGAGWGGRGLPDKVLDLANDHQIRTASLIRTVEEARDALANGYGLAVCSNYGFSDTRDKKGFAKQSGSWAHCYMSDSLVFTPSGNKTIDNFYIGDKLFNHIGEIDSVSHVFEKDYDGEVISVRAWGLPSFNVTAEHPILIFRNTIDIKEYEDIEESNGGVVVIKKKKQKVEKRKLMWIEAKDIIDTDWLVTPKTKFQSKSFTGLPYIGINNKTQNIPEQLNCPNSDVAWMFGLYIADGNSVKNHKICFTFSITEKNYIDKLKRAFNILGLKIRIKKYKTYIRVYCDSSVLARSFDSWFGHYSTERQIPEFLLTQGWDIESIIDGIFCGDGFYRKQIKYISMNNKLLIYQLRNLLINLNYKPTIFEQKRGFGSYTSNKKTFTLAWNLKDAISKLKRDSNYLYNPIRDIKCSQYIGKVYNLEVKNNHSYIIDGVASHNCMAWIACDDTNGEPCFLVQNSWGKWNDGGHPEWGPIPDGSFLIHADVAEGMLSQNGSYAFSGFDGFPLQKLPDYGFDTYL